MHSKDLYHKKVSSNQFCSFKNITLFYFDEMNSFFQDNYENSVSFLFRLKIK